MARVQRQRLLRQIWHLIGPTLALASVLMMFTPAFADSAPVTLLDFPVPNGHFYTQASGRGNVFGYAITDDGGAKFASEFTRLGGVDQLGYPSSERFQFGGYLTQATQKSLLQWRPELGRVELVNVFDVFSQEGLDGTLARSRLIPPTADNSPDRRLTWNQVTARHLAILDRNPAIKARYFADPDPIDDFGLPQAAQDFGGVFVIRCQRAAFQQWRIATPFARIGDVTIVNAGDLAKEFGIVPAPATVPGPVSNQLVAPLGKTINLDGEARSAAKKSAALARSALVRIDVMLSDGTGVASGIVIDQNGDILTNAHVVADAMLVRITFANGTSETAQIVGVDSADDLAVVNVPVATIGPGVSPATLVGGTRLRQGENVVAIGFSPFFPSAPATRVGIFQRAFPISPSVLRSDLYILPGDSGGMLLDLSGNVVGVNDEIRFTHQPQEPLISFSIDASDALRIAQSLIQGR